MKIKTKMVSCHTADSKPVKQGVNGTVILPPLVFPGYFQPGVIVAYKARSLSFERSPTKQRTPLG